MIVPDITGKPKPGLVNVLESNVLLLVCALPFLVPFGLTRNIDVQATVVSLTGALAWIAVFLRRQSWLTLPKTIRLVIGLYGLFCLLSLAVHPSVANLFGGPLMRLGSLELLACVGCGLALLAIPTIQLTKWLYSSATLLAAISLPYTLIKAQAVIRVGGLLHQPDFLAVLMAVGLLLGLSLWQTQARYRKLLVFSQLFLLTTLVLTQTRAVIALTLLISLLMVWRQHLAVSRKAVLSLAILLSIIIGLVGLRALAPNRVTDTSYASESISYRLSLQHFAAKASWHKPFFGYGAGTIAQALACSTLHNPALQITCHSHYYFDSSHNVFLDRFLALGWVGGLAFAVFVIMTLWKGLRKVGSETIFAYCALVIAAYYFTNVSNLEIEALFWVCLLRSYKPLTD